MSPHPKLAEATLPRDRVQTVPLYREHAEVYGGTETVLLVEDDAFVREATAKVMGFAGYRVLMASNAAEALPMYAQHRARLLLTDMILPGQSGRALAENLRFHDPELRVLFVTGYSERVSIAEGEQCLLKPYGAATMLQKVREVLGCSSAGGELRHACGSGWPAGFAAESA